ncbi:MAG: hypothetical protein RPU90_04265 [Candidatus Sedimenticola sp. (ex Thyasira tokunagai)]
MSLGMGLSAAVIRGGGQGDGYVPTPAPVFTGAIGNLTYNTGEAITPVDVSGEFSGAITSYAAVGAWPDGIGVDAGTGIINGTSSDEGVAAGLRVQAIGPGGIVNSNTFTTTGNAVNNAPTGSSNIVSTTEDNAYIFSAADFGYSDQDGDVLASIKITALESAGDLTLNGGAINQNQVITKADIDAGLLLFTPATNANGVSYDSFGFSVNDGTEDSVATYTITIDVTAVNDAPTGTVTIDNMTPTEGDILTAGNTLADADGMGAISYQWQRDGVDISGETGTAYTAVTADVGAAIRVVAGYTDGGGSAESVASVSTSAVVAAPSAQTRNYLTFGGNSYLYVTVVRSDTAWGVKAKAAWTSTADFSRIIAWNHPTHDVYKSILLGARENGTLQLYVEGVAASPSSVLNLDDGKLHQFEMTYDGTDVEVFVDEGATPVLTYAAGATLETGSMVLSVGARDDASGWKNFFTGVISDLELDNNGTVTKWDIDSGSTTTESPSIGTGDLTFVNVVAGDWEEFTLTGSEWLSADYVGELYGNSGTAQDDTDFFKLGEGDYQIKNASGAWKSKNFSKTPTLGRRYKYSYNGYAHGGTGVHQVKIGTNVTSTPVDGVYSGYKVADGSNFQVRNSTATSGVDHWIKFKDFTIYRALGVAA